MEALINDDHGLAPELYNSRLETGLRALIVLDALYPRACGVAELTWFDHLVVHSADLDGPESLHPALPARAGELLVRRRLIEESLRLMQQVHLIDVIHGIDGISFIASDDAPSFTDLLQTGYSKQLKLRARWLAERFKSTSYEDIEQQVRDRIGRWTAEFVTGTVNR